MITNDDRDDLAIATVLLAILLLLAFGLGVIFALTHLVHALY